MVQPCILYIQTTPHERDSTDAELQTYLCSLCSGDQSLADILDGEGGGCLDVIPVLLGEGVRTAEKRTEEEEDRVSSASEAQRDENGREAHGGRALTPSSSLPSSP